MCSSLNFCTFGGLCVDKDLSRIEATVGVKSGFDPAHDTNASFAELAEKVALLGDADSMLAGDRSAHLKDFFVELREEGVDVFNLSGMTLVGQGRGVQVAVSGMAECGDPNLVFFF
jgi:hypothetical protein